jgi:hypothetical protein
MTNTTKSHTTLSSAFNQFKCFLALSLLITFSFNAFSVDDPQQFNKEAYLDLIPICTSFFECLSVSKKP